MFPASRQLYPAVIRLFQVRPAADFLRFVGEYFMIGSYFSRLVDDICRLVGDFFWSNGTFPGSAGLGRVDGNISCLSSNFSGLTTTLLAVPVASLAANSPDSSRYNLSYERHFY